MGAAIGTDAEIKAIVEAALQRRLTRTQARQLHRFGSDAVAFVMLAAASRTAVKQAQSRKPF